MRTRLLRLAPLAASLALAASPARAADPTPPAAPQKPATTAPGSAPAAAGATPPSATRPAGAAPKPWMKAAPQPSPPPPAAAAPPEPPAPEPPAAPPPEPPKPAVEPPAPKPAAPPSAAAKAEASERFQRGLSLFEAGNLNAALVEFERAYEVVPHPTVLFNIGLVNVALERPAEAERALETLVAAPGTLSTDRLIKAKDTLSEVKTRIGQIELTTIAGAQIELDGVVVGTTPLKAPLRVATGTHVLGALAPGHAPLRKSISVTSGQTTTITLEPPVIEGRLAHLALRTGLPGASLFVDGELVAKTPIATTLTFLPGTHELTLRREGYLDAKTRIALSEGATGEIELEPEEDTIFVKTRGGDLGLSLSEPNTTITVDGKVRGAYVTPIRLSPGPHRLLVECAGFRPLERDVVIAEGKLTELALTLEPTPEKRVQHADEANTDRLVGLVTGGVGLAILGGSAGFLGWNAGNKADQQALFDDLFDRCVTGTEVPEVCETLSDREDDVNQALSLDVVGGIGIGAGAATLVTGLVMFLVADDPDKYESQPTESLGELALRPLVQTGPNGSFFGVGGTFR
jgi:hypothetical protein